MAQVPWNKGTGKMTKAVKAAFVEVLRETASPTQAAKFCGVSTNIAYIARDRDLEFRVEWDKAVEQAMDQLQGEAYRRAVHGVVRPVVQGGHLVRDDGGEVLNTTEYSDRLMEVLLRWKHPQALATRLNVRVEEPLGLEPEVLILMAPGDRRALLELLKKYAALAEPRRQALLEAGNG
ncbi:MAG: hypothetical protein ACM3JG_17910 [Thiohalocapsa sp.]